MLHLFSPDTGSSTLLPLAGSPVQAGFPSPADDYIEARLDLNEHLVPHPNATFFVRVSGESMIEAGIRDGAVLVVDRSLEAQHQDIVVAALDGEFTVKQLVYRGELPWLVPCNPTFSDIRIDEDMDAAVWGVVTAVINRFR